MDHVRTERRPGGVAVVTLDRPPANALSVELLDELAAGAEALSGDADLRAVVLTGSRKVFSTGAEITQIDRQAGVPAVIDAFRRAYDVLAAVPRPVVAAVSGYTLGGGLEAALACDLRVASESARLGFPEVHLGLFPGAGGTQRLPRLVGAARAKEMIWSGRTVRAEEALAIGLVDRVEPVDRYLDAAVEWAAALGAGPAAAKALAKRAVDEGLERPLAAGLDLERELFAAALATDDAAAGIASFLEQGPGKARFTGR